MSNDTFLLPGESLNPLEDSLRATTVPLDSEIEEKYARGEVRIVVEQARYPLKQVPEIVASSDYNLQPDFQRRPRWNPEKQSRLIESLVMNVPVPPVFLYEQDYGRYEVMDGRQRLTAISDFYNDRFVLEGLKEWPELNGRHYSELPEQIRRGIDRRFLSAIVLLHETAKSHEQADRLKQLVFERINSGGEDLSAQEKRNALCPGKMNRLCTRLARHPSLCSLWGIPLPTQAELEQEANWSPPSELVENDSYRTMEDVELVLRFFAHRQRHRLWRSGTRFEDYLTYYLKAANKFSDGVLNSLERLFVDTCDLAYDVLGERAFWLWRARANTHVWVERPAYIAYDPIMLAFSRLLPGAIKLRANKNAIRDGLRSLYEANYIAFDGRKTNPSDIKKRDDLFLNLFSHYTT